MSTEVGQRVMIDPKVYDTLAPEVLAKTYTTEKVVGQGDDAFTRLQDDNGDILKHHQGADHWFRATELLPARAVGKKPGSVPRAKEITTMSAATQKLLNLANDYEKRFGLSKADAAKKASADLTEDELVAYRGGEEITEIKTPPAPTGKGLTPGVTALSQAAQRLMAERGLSREQAVELALVERFGGAAAASGDELYALSERRATELGIPLREAARQIASERPDLVAAR